MLNRIWLVLYFVHAFNSKLWRKVSTKLVLFVLHCSNFFLTIRAYWNFVFSPYLWRWLWWESSKRRLDFLRNRPTSDAFILGPWRHIGPSVDWYFHLLLVVLKAGNFGNNCYSILSVLILWVDKEIDSFWKIRFKINFFATSISTIVLACVRSYLVNVPILALKEFLTYIQQFFINKSWYLSHW